jgi:large subunit ribosomal protein L19e
MTGLKNQRRLAADILKCGENRVWMDPERISDISGATTRADVKKFINDGLIRAKQKNGISSYRKRKLKAQKEKGRRRGHGSLKGGVKTRMPRKMLWAKRIRPLRRTLKELKDENVIERNTYHNYYVRAKSGAFTSKGQLLQSLRNEGHISDSQLESFKNKGKQQPLSRLHGGDKK